MAQQRLYAQSTETHEGLQVLLSLAQPVPPPGVYSLHRSARPDGPSLELLQRVLTGLHQLPDEVRS